MKRIWAATVACFLWRKLMTERIIMPCVPLRGLSVFPRTILHFDIGREKSVKALENAMATDKLLFLTSQKDENILLPHQRIIIISGRW